MSEKVTKRFSSDLTIIEGERAVVAKITTAAVDRDGEVVIPQGVNSKDFEANPVVYYNHDYWDHPIGQCVSIKREDGAIVAKTVFATRPETHPEGKEWAPDTIFSLVKQRVIRGFSIGFIPIESRAATDKDLLAFGAECRRVHTKTKLLEYSVAPLPCNQEALTLAVSKGLCSEELAKRLQRIEEESGEADISEKSAAEIISETVNKGALAPNEAKSAITTEDEEGGAATVDSAGPDPISPPPARKRLVYYIENETPRTSSTESAMKAAALAAAKKRGRVCYYA